MTPGEEKQDGAVVEGVDAYRRQGGTEPTTMYPIGDQMAERIDNDFTYHAPKPGQVERYNMLRENARTMALLIVRATPPSREQSLALTKLEEAIMHANSAIARNE